MVFTHLLLADKGIPSIPRVYDRVIPGLYRHN